MKQSPIASSERIRELWAVDADVPDLLASAGHAINALTDRPIRAEDGGPDGSMPDLPPADVTAHKKAFTDASKAYFTNLQSILARLRRSVYALEEAGIIESEPPVVSNGREAADGKKSDEDRVTNGGLGNLDVGLLNSRVNDVARNKELELLEEARDMLVDRVGGSDV